MATVSPTPTAGAGADAGSNNSPLLFFVALGFGVVFTNLWIIVGVKYCFRYNQRHRQARNDENGEPIDMVNVPRTRRRREKKLISVEDVNNRFPVTKYKSWRASRAEAGLSTSGGIDHLETHTSGKQGESQNSGKIDESHEESHDVTTATPGDRAECSGAMSPDSMMGRKSHEIQLPEPAHVAAEKSDAVVPDLPSENRLSTDNRSLKPTDSHPQDNEEDDNEDAIGQTITNELMAGPGDSCAICLDMIDDDDDVRGLTCGHAFHAACIDPWLTSRRACCPLCKADYYVPKPRPEGEAPPQEEERRSSRRRQNNRGVSDGDTPYQTARMPPFASRMVLAGRFLPNPQGEDANRTDRERGLRRAGNNAAGNTDTADNSNGDEVSPQQPAGWRSRFARINIPMFGRNRAAGSQNGDANASSTVADPPTPRQLEAATPVAR